MASSFFQLGYHPTNSPTLDVSGNLGIALRGFDRLGNNLETFGANLAKTDQDNADRILAERMNQYKTEADLMNAIQNGKLYDGISGRVSAKVSQQALQDRFTMLQKDIDRRDYENNLEYDKNGDIKNLYLLAQTTGNPAYAQKANALARERALNSAVSKKLHEDINPTRNALTQAGRLGFERRKYDDLLRDEREIEDLKRFFIDHASNAGEQFDYQKARDAAIAYAKEKGYSNFTQNKFDDWTAFKTGGGKNYYGTSRVLQDMMSSQNEASPEEKMLGSPDRLPFYDDAGRITNKEQENVDKTLADLNMRNASALNVYSTNFGSVNPQKLYSSMQHYQKMDDNTAIEEYMKKNHIPTEDFGEVKKAILELNAEGLSIPQRLAIADNGGNIEVGTTRGFLGSKYNINLPKEVADNLREINKSPERRQAFLAQIENINSILSNTAEAESLQNQRKEAYKNFIEAKKAKDKRDTAETRKAYKDAKQYYENLNRYLRRAVKDANTANDQMKAIKSKIDMQITTDQLNQNSLDMDYFLGLKDKPTKFSRGD